MRWAGETKKPPEGGLCGHGDVVLKSFQFVNGALSPLCINEVAKLNLAAVQKLPPPRPHRVDLERLALLRPPTRVVPLVPPGLDDRPHPARVDVLVWPDGVGADGLFDLVSVDAEFAPGLGHGDGHAATVA